ncbi:MAG: hypothetical protein KIT16_07650 [Rhodospirillaceae bacterium]|nr:hypothetical protein [Rhodospirillaceae bacterium]
MDAAAAEFPGEGETPISRSPATIEWEIGVPLATNRRMLRDMGLAFGLAVLIGYAFVALALAAQGEWKGLLPLAIGFGAGGVGLYLLGVLIMLIVFGNRMRMRFRVGPKGVLASTVDRRAKVANRLAIVAGALGGKPSVAGAGMIAASGEDVATGWAAVQHADFNPRGRRIALRNRWRTMLILYCTAENYATVEALVRKYVAAVPAAKRVARGNPVPGLLGWTVAVIAASFPAFVLPYPLTLDLLAPMILLAFAVATVWLIPLFGYVIFACVAYLAVAVTMKGLATRKSQFSDRIYSGFDLLDSSEWVLLMVFAAGMLFLVWFGLRAVRGRIPTALTTDAAEMDDGA